MREEDLARERAPAAITRVSAFVWIICAAVLVFTAENLWVDPWLQRRIHRLPSLIPEPLGALWLLVFGVLVLALVLVAVALGLLFRDATVPRAQKLASAGGLLAAAVLCAAWAVTTSGAQIPMMDALFHRHKVTLKWNASTTPVSGYNVYRSDKPASYDFAHPINQDLVRDTTYVDTKVKSGHTYFYVTRAKDAQGVESANSNEIQVDVP
ncbi:MAG TPA: hypothetical protein VMJ35_10665 [Dongiaceae bacterium]|nr:hypothetical protein [Dongiaceae bacterium]